MTGGQLDLAGYAVLAGDLRSATDKLEARLVKLNHQHLAAKDAIAVLEHALQFFAPNPIAVQALNKLEELRDAARRQA